MLIYTIFRKRGAIILLHSNTRLDERFFGNVGWVDDLKKRLVVVSVFKTRNDEIVLFKTLYDIRSRNCRSCKSKLVQAR